MNLDSLLTLSQELNIPFTYQPKEDGTVVISIPINHQDRNKKNPAYYRRVKNETEAVTYLSAIFSFLEENPTFCRIHSEGLGGIFN